MNSAKIIIDGKEYTLLFGLTCYELFFERCFKYKEVYLNEEGELTKFGLANLFHCAYIDACLDKQKSISLSFNDISGWTTDSLALDEGKKEIASLLELWANSKDMKKLGEKLDEKKNGTEQTLSSQTSVVSMQSYSDASDTSRGTSTG